MASHITHVKNTTVTGFLPKFTESLPFFEVFNGIRTRDRPYRNLPKNTAEQSTEIDRLFTGNLPVLKQSVISGVFLSLHYRPFVYRFFTACLPSVRLPFVYRWFTVRLPFVYRKFTGFETVSNYGRVYCLFTERLPLVYRQLLTEQVDPRAHNFFCFVKLTTE
jgi:hypothetical protein